MNYEKNWLETGEYEKCSFINCNFYNSDVSEIVFIDCRFESCSLSLINVNEATFNNVEFYNCKMAGVIFENCNDFCLSVDFNYCILSQSSFARKKLRKTSFKDSVLIGVDFSESDLKDSVFSNCNLSGVLFENTILENADFRTSYNYIIDPERNYIKKTKFH